MSYLSQTITLALPSTDVPLVYQHPLSHMITSLPYVDEENDSQIMAQVQKLIQDEMKVMPKKDYLANLGLKQVKVELSPMLTQEFERVKSGSVLEGIDMERYKIEDFLPPNKENDLNAIRNAINKADIQKQHNSFKNYRLINLELLNKYGPASWKEYLDETEALSKRYFVYRRTIILDRKEKEANNIKYSIDEINAKRKFDQFQGKEKMSEYQEKIYYMLYKNQALEMECDRLDTEIRDIRLKKLKKV